MASVISKTLVSSTTGKIGDGSPTYTFSYAEMVGWTFNTTGTDPGWPVFSLDGGDSAMKIKVNSADSSWNGTATIKVTMHRWLPNGTEKVGYERSLSLEKVPNPNPKAFALSNQTYTCTNGKASSITCSVPNSNLAVLVHNNMNIYGVDKNTAFYFSHMYVCHYTRKILLNVKDYTTNWYGQCSVNVPELVRWFKYGPSYSGGFSTTMNYPTVTTPASLYKITSSGTYNGWPGTFYGTRSLKIKVPFTCNGPGTLSVVFRGVSGSANGDVKRISTAVSGRFSGEFEVSGSATFKNGAYNMSFEFNGDYTWTSDSVPNILSKNNGLFSGKPGIYFYAPGDPYSPPNYNPSYYVENITPTGQFDTNQTKTIKARVYLTDPGVSRYWLSSMVYTLKAYWNDGTLIGTYTLNDSNMNNISTHYTDFSTTVQVRSSKRHQEEYVYWTVTGTSKDTAGVSRSGGSSTSGKVNVFWAYVEPSVVSFLSSKVIDSSGPTYSNNRAQLYYGGTILSFQLQATINAWGDRPGTRNYEFSINHPTGTAVKMYGKNNTSDTGTKSNNYSYTIPDNWVGSDINFTVYKRLDNTEYSFSGDYKNPSIGKNHSTGGTISLYEVIGGVDGMIDIAPSILMVTIPLIVTGQGTFDKQSAQKVRFYVEVYDYDSNKVIGQWVLGNTAGDIFKKLSIDLSSSSFTIPEPHLYELRLKADVTELLGNVHTYTFYTTTRQAFLPPRYTLTEKTDMLLPPTSETSLLIRQKATNTYTYRVTYDLALSSSLLFIEYYLAGSPNTKRVKQVNILPQGYTGGGFNGTYTFPNPSTLDPSDPMYDPEGFALGTKVTAYITSTWNLPGVTNVYSNSSGSVYYNVTETRYVYFLTRNVETERWLNKMHNVLPTRTDKTSKKIFVETDIS